MVTMTSDYLTCGECLKEFPLQQITLFIQHKKLGCEDDIGESNPDPELRCNNCPQGFMTAWALLVHAQLTHNLKIFLENASKTVLKNPDLPQIDNGPLLPAIEIVKNVESSNTFQGEYDERPMNVDQKPLLLSNGSELFNGIFSSTVQTASSNLAKQIDSPPKQLILSPNSTANANQSVKMGSTITVTRTIRPNEDTGPYPSLSPEKTISSETKQPSGTSPQKPSSVLPIVTIQPTAKDQPTNTSQPVKVDPPLSSNGSSVALSTSRSPLRLPPTQVLQSNSTKDKVETAKIVSLTSVAPKSTTLNSDNSSTILAQPKNTTTASNERIQGTNITEISPPSTKTYSVVSVTNNSKSIPQKSSASPNKAFHELTFHDSQQNIVQPLLVDSSMLNIVSNVEKVLEKTASEASPSKKDIEDMCLDSTSSPECCDSQDCGVKVIPGSHEHLKKCCNAVVPKKRKRHMELKHMPFAWSSSRQASRKLLYRSITASSARSAASQFLNKSSANTIYIDLEPDSMAGTQSPSTSETRFKVTRSSSMLDISTNEAIETPSPSQPPGTQSKQRSLILKPCSVFSIPLNYAFSPAQAAANLATPPKNLKPEWIQAMALLIFYNLQILPP